MNAPLTPESAASCEPVACDCLNECGDDPWLKNGRAKPCKRLQLLNRDLATLATPDDSVQVPTLEPDSEMLNRGADELRQALTMLNSGRSYQYVVGRVYKAMLAAKEKA